MHEMKTIIVLVLLEFNFIPQRSHHLLTLPRSRIRDSGTVTLTHGDGTTAIKVVISITDQLILQNEKGPEVYIKDNNAPKYCHAALPT